MSGVDKVTKDTVNQGGILAFLYFDIHGNSEEGIKNLGVGFIQRVIKEPGVVYARGEIAEPLKEEDIYSTSVEVKVLIKSFLELMALCAKYSPFSIEILQPNELKFSVDKLHDLLMFMANTTHGYKKHIFTKTSTPEDLKNYQKHIQNKMKLGKLLMEKKKK